MSDNINYNQDVWSSDQPLIIVSDHLPVKLDYNEEDANNPTGGWSASWSLDRLVEAHNTFSHLDIAEHVKVKFIGRPDRFIPVKDQPNVTNVLAAFNCLPIYLTLKESEAYYEGYCKATLWPNFHNIVDAYRPIKVSLKKNQTSSEDKSDSWNRAWQQDCWNAYTMVNKRVAELIAKVYRPGNVVWVQDYHLMLVPSYLARHLRASVNIGFFLHVPFPSSEVFRTLASRKELLRGMLNADHIGFHLFDYARHFLSCCKRILGISAKPSTRGQLALEYGGRRVAITCSHMALDVIRVERSLVQDSVRARIENLQRQYCGKIIFSGCDSVETLSGIALKMLAFHEFLIRYPEQVGSVVLLQIGVTKSARKFDARKCREEIMNVMRDINEYHEENVVTFEEVKEFSFEDRMALWKVSDVQVTTVLRDGLNTVPLEFIASNRNSPGVVILSEFSGCSRLLTGVLTVNPWEINQVVDAMNTAISMPLADRETRGSCDIEFAACNPPYRWAKCVLDDVVSARKKDKDFMYQGTGFGLDFRVMEVNANFRKLKEEELTSAFRKSSKRIIFLDFYRTLVSESVMAISRDEWPEVPESVLSSLEQLCKDRRNAVFIVSGCKKSALEQRFGHVPNLGLVSEHGYFIRWNDFGQDRKWDCLWTPDESTVMPNCMNWRERVKSIMEMYAIRTNGAHVFCKESAILFRYAKANAEYASTQAAELKEHLEGMLLGWPFSVLQGKDYIEVRPKGLNKGFVVKKIIERMQLQSSKSIDFALCIGDDAADELMFEKLGAFASNPRIIAKGALFSCTVGQKPSKAKFYVDDNSEVATLLQALIRATMKANKNYSVSDIQAFARAQKNAERRVGSRNLSTVHEEGSDEEARQHLSVLSSRVPKIPESNSPCCNNEAISRKVKWGTAIVLVLMAYQKTEPLQLWSQYVSSKKRYFLVASILIYYWTRRKRN